MHALRGNMSYFYLVHKHLATGSEPKVVCFQFLFSLN